MATSSYDAAAKPPTQGVEMHRAATKSHISTELKTDQAVKIISETFTNTIERQSASMKAEKSPDTWGDVVVFVGTSTAGKSKLIGEIRETVPDVEETGIDKKSGELFLQHLQKNHHDDLEFIIKILHSVNDEKPERLARLTEPTNENPLFDYIWDGKIPQFNESISTEDQQRFHELCRDLNKEFSKIPIVNLMMEDVLVTSQKGKSVILDMVRIDGIYESRLHKEHPSLKVALVFCPFEDLVDRIIDRNKKALDKNNLVTYNPANVRSTLDPLIQFSALFGPKPEGSEAVPLQTLTWEEFSASFELLSDHIIECTNPKDPAAEKARHEEVKVHLLTVLGFSAQVNVVELVPKLPEGSKGYDYIINTSL